ncbi:hypothetical protein D3C71_1692110 [compost metagenome]
MEAVHQQRNQPQMAVEAEKQQHRQQVEQPCQHWHVRPAAGIEEGGERQTHLHADHFAGQPYRREGELHGQAQRDTDQDLLGRQPQTGRRENRHGAGGQPGGNQYHDQPAEANFHLLADLLFAEYRRGADQRQNAQQRPEILAEPDAELRAVKCEHG